MVAMVIDCVSARIPSATTSGSTPWHMRNSFTPSPSVIVVVRQIFDITSVPKLPVGNIEFTCYRGLHVRAY